MLVYFFNDTTTTEIYTLSLHDALPICPGALRQALTLLRGLALPVAAWEHEVRSEEHTSELQSQSNLVCRLLLEKKKNYQNPNVYWLSLILAPLLTTLINRDAHSTSHQI